MAFRFPWARAEIGGRVGCAQSVTRMCRRRERTTQRIPVDLVFHAGAVLSGWLLVPNAAVGGEFCTFQEQPRRAISLYFR